jgi:hypothetical protein
LPIAHSHLCRNEEVFVPNRVPVSNNLALPVGCASAVLTPGEAFAVAEALLRAQAIADAPSEEAVSIGAAGAVELGNGKVPLSAVGSA